MVKFRFIKQATLESVSKFENIHKKRREAGESYEDELIEMILKKMVNLIKKVGVMQSKKNYGKNCQIINFSLTHNSKNEVIHK